VTLEGFSTRTSLGVETLEGTSLVALNLEGASTPPRLSRSTGPGGTVLITKDGTNLEGAARALRVSPGFPKSSVIVGSWVGTLTVLDDPVDAETLEGASLDAPIGGTLLGAENLEGVSRD
jgi:hypothetical protein